MSFPDDDYSDLTQESQLYCGNLEGRELQSDELDCESPSYGSDSDTFPVVPPDHLHDPALEAQLALESAATAVYISGVCINNGKKNARGGAGVWFGDGHPSNLSVPLHDEKRTTPRAQLYAMLRALQSVPRDQPLHVFSDSTYAIGVCDTWRKAWKDNLGRRSNNRAPLNRDLVDALGRELELRAATVTKFSFVYGFRGNYGNDSATKLAYRAVKLR